MNFYQQLHELAQAAENCVRVVIPPTKKLLLLKPEPDPDIDLESLLELLESLPTVQMIDKHNCVDYLSIVALVLEEDELSIEGIYSGEGFPEKAKIPLNSLRSEEILLLADHLAEIASKKIASTSEENHPNLD